MLENNIKKVTIPPAMVIGIPLKYLSVSDGLVILNLANRYAQIVGIDLP